jgi:uncharacterized coiled-coil protein SlyX
MARTTTAANASQIAQLHARIDDLTTRLNDLQTLYTEQQGLVDHLIGDIHDLQGINHDLAETATMVEKHHSTLKAVVDWINRNKAAAAPAKSEPPFATTTPAAKPQTQPKPAQNRAADAARPAASKDRRRVNTLSIRAILRSAEGESHCERQEHCGETSHRSAEHAVRATDGIVVIEHHPSCTLVL